MTLELLPGLDPGIHRFISGDHRDLFKLNRKRLGKGWKYYERKLCYSNNSNGYRAPEWNNIDWQNSVIIFGCSFVYGIGHDDKDTLPKCIESKISKPVINLGMGGTGMPFICENARRIYEAGITPDTVLVLLPPFGRTNYFTSYGVENCGHWVKDKFYRKYHEMFAYDNANVLTMQRLFNLLIEKLWNVPAYFYTFEDAFLSLAKQSNIVDKARDDLHPGDESFKLMSNLIAEDLNK